MLLFTVFPYVSAEPDTDTYSDQDLKEISDIVLKWLIAAYKHHKQCQGD